MGAEEGKEVFCPLVAFENLTARAEEERLFHFRFSIRCKQASNKNKDVPDIQTFQTFPAPLTFCLSLASRGGASASINSAKCEQVFLSPPHGMGDSATEMLTRFHWGARSSCWNVIRSRGLDKAQETARLASVSKLVCWPRGWVHSPTHNRSRLIRLRKRH